MADALLSLSGVRAGYGDAVVLNGIDLEIYRGEDHALIGDNGAGNSTLIQLLSGVDQPNEGQIYVDGQLVGDG